jgi:hypothetical protein
MSHFPLILPSIFGEPAVTDTPAARTLLVDAGTRTVLVNSADRTFSVTEYDRTFTIGARP